MSRVQTSAAASSTALVAKVSSARSTPATITTLAAEISQGGFSQSLDADYGFDILARAGLKLNESTLAYALAGYSWQHFDLDVPPFIPGGDFDWDSSGFSVGGGLETAVTEKVSVNLEYRYSQYDSEDFDGETEIEPSFHTVRIGAKYKFN